MSRFKKISIFHKDVVELLLYRVETMLEFTNTYGDMDEPFYNSIASSYNEACTLIKNEKLEKEYSRLMNESYSFGWGVYDSLKDIYNQVFA